MKTRKLTYSAILLVIAIVLPFLTGQIPEIGQALLPMHIPILLCGFICGWRNGLIIGIIAPILRSVLFGMPPMFPIALSMSIELGMYGLIAGLFYSMLPKNNTSIYTSLIVAMLFGRMAWGMSMMLMMSMTGGTFTFGAFITAAFVSSIPGIILQLILIPIIVISLKNHIVLVSSHQE